MTTQEEDIDPVRNALINFAEENEEGMLDTMFLFFCVTYQVLVGISPALTKELTCFIDEAKSGRVDAEQATQNIEKIREKLTDIVGEHRTYQ